MGIIYIYMYVGLSKFNGYIYTYIIYIYAGYLFTHEHVGV